MLTAAFHQCLAELRAHWFRSFLTTIGIVMGVTSVLSMMALTEGSIRGAERFARETGSQTKSAIHAEQPPAEQQLKASQSRGLTLADAEALRQVPGITWVSAVRVFDNERISRGSRTTGEARLHAAQLEMLAMNRLEIGHGRWLTETDLEQKAPVCVLGARIADALYDDPATEAVGSVVTIRGTQYRVVGVGKLALSQSEEKARQSGKASAQAARRKKRGGTWGEWDEFWWKNSFVAIPFSTAQASGAFDASGRPRDYVTEIQFGFADPAQRAKARDRAERTLLAQHNGIEDFKVEADDKEGDELQRQIFQKRVTGGVIAGISLFVGALGIINIMLASVADRVRELGIRRAVGASHGAIFWQIIFESVTLASFAGVLGIVGGLALVRVLESLSPEQNVPVITLTSLLLSFGSSVLTGLVSGLVPAFKAVRIPVIEALRSE